MAESREPLMVLPSTSTQDACTASSDTDIPPEESQSENNRLIKEPGSATELADENKTTEFHELTPLPQGTSTEKGRELPKKNEFVGFRILCLDGGGSRGIVMATVIEKLEEYLNDTKFHNGEENNNNKKKSSRVKLWELFDLITGTSTGGILAAALGLLKLDGNECKELYEELIPQLFRERWFAKLRAVRYSKKKLEKLLKNHFEESTFSALHKISTSPVVAFTAFDLDNNKMILFSNTDEKDKKDGTDQNDTKNEKDGTEEKDKTDEKDITVAQALRATSAAPTYFKSIEINGRHYVDGGLGANCPAVKALRFANDYWNKGRSLEIPDPSKQDELSRMRSCELLVSLGTGMNTPGKKPGETGGCLAGLVGWGRKLTELVTHSESIYEEAWRDLRRQNTFAYHERLNPPEDTEIGKIGLDSTKTKKMVKTAQTWLEGSESDVRRTAHELIAKNYYADVDTRNIRTNMKKYARISAMLRRGSFQCAIRQRNQLFAINKSHFEAEGTDHVKKIEITEDTNNRLRLCIKPAWHVNDKAEVQVSVYFKPDPTSEPQTRYHIGGSPFTFTLYNPFKTKGMCQRPCKGLLEKVAETLIVEPGTLTNEMIRELSEHFTDVQKLLSLAIVGLHVPEVERFLNNCNTDVSLVAFKVLNWFCKTKETESDAYVKLVKALYAVSQEDLALSVLKAKFTVPENRYAKELVVKPGTLTGMMMLTLSERFTDAQELMLLGTYGLQLPHNDVRMHLEKNSRYICEASLAILKDWRKKQKGRDEPYVDLVKALYAVGQEDLARSVLRAEITIPESSSVDKEKNPELTYDTSIEMIFKLAQQLYLVEDIKRLGIYGLRMKESEVLTPLTNNRSTVVAAYYVLRAWRKRQPESQKAKTELLEALRKVGRSDWAKSVLGMDPKLKEETTEDEDTDEDKVESLQNEDETERPERELTDVMILNASGHFVTEEDVRYFGIEGLHLPEYKISRCITENQGNIFSTALAVLLEWFKTQESREKALRELTNALLESRIFNKQTLRELFKSPY